MERIGMAASKMAHGNLFLYNLYVIIICMVFSLFTFVLAGMVTAFALILITSLINAMSAQHHPPLEFNAAFIVCMLTFTVVIALFNLFAILRNLKFSKTKIDSSQIPRDES